MKKISTIVFITILMLYFTICPSSYADESPRVTVLVSQPSVDEGDNFKIQVLGYNISNLYAYELNVNYESMNAKPTGADANGAFAFTNGLIGSSSGGITIANASSVLSEGTSTLIETFTGKTSGVNLDYMGSILAEIELSSNVTQDIKLYESTLTNDLNAFIDQAKNIEIKLIDKDLNVIPVKLEMPVVTSDILLQSEGDYYVGRPIAFKALSTGGENLKFKYWLMKPGGAWEVVREYDANASFSFTPEVAGLYQFGAWISSETISDKEVVIQSFEVKDIKPVESVSLQVDQSVGSGEVNSPMNIQASIVGGLNPRMKFWLMKPGGIWEVSREYNQSESYTFTPSRPGTYKVGVWVIDDFSESPFIDIIDVDVREESPSALILNGLTTDQSNNTSEVGMAVQLIPEITDGTNVKYQYWVRKPNSNWEVAQVYTNSSQFTYTPDQVGAYQFGVWATDDNSVEHQVKIIDYIVSSQGVQALKLNALNTNMTGNTSEKNKSIALSADIEGGSNVQYQYWVKEPGGQWVIAQSYSAEETYVYTPILTGQYQFGIWVVDDASSAHQVEIIDYTVTGDSSPSVVLNGLSTDRAGNTSEKDAAVVLLPNTIYGDNVQYQYWVKKPGQQWEIAQSYSSAESYTYFPTEVGQYQFGVWVIDNLNSVYQVEIIDYEVTATSSKPVELVSLSSDKFDNTSEKGVNVGFATHVEGGINVLQQFWVKRPGKQWEIAQNYSSSNSFSYTPQDVGAYQFGVWVIDDNNKTEQIKIIDYTVTGQSADPVKLNGLNTNMTGNTSETGQAVTLSADVKGGTNVQYQYWVMQPGGAWEIVQVYTSANTLAYTPKTPGDYKFGIWVIDDNNASYQVDIIDYTVTGEAAEPVKLNGLNTNMTGNTSTVDQALTLSADITGGSNVQYQFWIMQPSGAWEIVQAYSSVGTYTYTPTVVGVYQFGIWIIDDNNKTQQIDIINYTVTESSADVLRDEVKMSADEIVVEEEPLVDEAPVAEETQEEALVEEPVVEQVPVTEETQEEGIVEEPALEEEPAAEETQEEALVEEPVVEEVPVTEETQEEEIVKEQAVEKVPAAEEIQEEALVEEPVVEEVPVTEDLQEEEIVEEPVLEEVPATEETQKGAVEEESPDEEPIEIIIESIDIQ